MGNSLATCLALLMAPLPAGGPELVNPSFETAATTAGEPPPGWERTHGAGRAGGTPSFAESVAGASAAGDRALVLEASSATGSFQYVSQTLDAEPGERWTLGFSVKSENVRREGSQFDNAYVRLGFQSADGKYLAQELSPPLKGTRDWGRLRLTEIAPEGTVRCQVGCFLSVSGKLVLDDFELETAPVAPFSDKRVREAAFDAAAEHLLASYPFFALEGFPAPAKLFKRHRAKVIKERDPADFARALARMLDELNDLHVQLRFEGQLIPTNPRNNPNPTNWNFEAVAAHFSDVVSQGATHLIARVPLPAQPERAVGYVRLTSFSAPWDELKRIDALLDDMDDVIGWIYDVRPNGGGDETKAELFAARFVDQRTEYARSRYRDAFAPGDVEAFTESYPRWIDPRPDRSADVREVAVLQGPFCVSSTEGFLLMMGALEQCTLVGLPSRGASANPASFTIAPGLVLTSSRWQSLTLEDECIERRGVLPDLEVAERPSKYLKADPTFEAALRLFE